MCLWYKVLKNTVGKGEIARNGQFRVFHDPLVSLNFQSFDPQIFLNDPQNLQFTFFISYEGGHCDPLNRKLRENPGQLLLFPQCFQKLSVVDASK